MLPFEPQSLDDIESDASFFADLEGTLAQGRSQLLAIAVAETVRTGLPPVYVEMLELLYALAPCPVVHQEHYLFRCLPEREQTRFWRHPQVNNRPWFFQPPGRYPALSARGWILSHHSYGPGTESRWWGLWHLARAIGRAVDWRGEHVLSPYLQNDDFPGYSVIQYESRMTVRNWLRLEVPSFLYAYDLFTRLGVRLREDVSLYGLLQTETIGIGEHYAEYRDVLGLDLDTALAVMDIDPQAFDAHFPQVRARRD